MPKGAQQAHSQDPSPGGAPLCPDATHGRQAHPHHWPGTRHGGYDHDGGLLQPQASGQVRGRRGGCVLQGKVHALKDRGAPARGQWVRNGARNAPKSENLLKK